MWRSRRSVVVKFIDRHHRTSGIIVSNHLSDKNEAISLEDIRYIWAEAL